jgi:diguanylate cyclase (GGDEF)-like protein/PAS domain S-box-containing protein
VVATVASSLSVLGLILAENAGLLPQPDYTVTFTQWFTYTGLFGITGGLVFFALQTTRIALMQAKQELEERERVEGALRTSQGYLQALTDSTQQSFVLLDCSATILSFNRIAAQYVAAVFGHEMHVGDSMFAFVLEQDRTPFTDNFNKALRGETTTVEKLFSSTMGQEHWFSVTYAAAHTETGHLIGVCFNSMDITERKQAEHMLRKLSQAVEQSPASIIITDLKGTIEYANQHFSMVTGYSIAEVIGKNPRILKTNQTRPGTHRHLWATLTAGKPWRGEFVNRKKDGSYYYEAASISPITDLKGTITHYLAVKEDITERKQTEQAVRESEERFRMMFENHHAVMMLIEPVTGRIVDVNHSAAAFYGYDRATLMQMSINAVNTLSPAEIQQEMQQAARNEVNYFVFPHRLANGDIRIVEIHSSPLILHGQPTLFSIIHDITERKQIENALKTANEQLQARVAEVEQLQVELREQALRDPLTGLYNRRYLSETLPHELQRANREDGIVSVILMDIDRFKTINDTYGHPVGDIVLMVIASLITKHARSWDVTCRYGGEEFLLVLPGATLDLAAKRAEEIRQVCAETIIRHGKTNLSVTLSFGVAAYPAHGQTGGEIIMNADNALYISKQTGRNRVTIWNPDEPSIGDTVQPADPQSTGN